MLQLLNDHLHTNKLGLTLLKAGSWIGTPVNGRTTVYDPMTIS